MSDNIKKWTEALRSGEFEQATGTLETTILKDSENVQAFCCLGVGCKIADPKDMWNWEVKDLPPDDFLRWLGILGEYDWTETEDPLIDFPPLLAERSGISLRGLTCSSLNDRLGFNFEQIADLIDYFGVYAPIVERDE